MKTVLFFSLTISLLWNSSLPAQSVYNAVGNNINVRSLNCTTASSYGQISAPHSFVVLSNTGLNCNYDWYMIDIPNAHNITGYPTHAYVATNFLTQSSSPSYFLTVINVTTGLLIKNSANGTQTWIQNSGYGPEYASFDNGQKLARTSSNPIQIGSATWYEVYLTPNCKSASSGGSQKLTGWVSDGIGNGGPYLLAGVVGIDEITENSFLVYPNPNNGSFTSTFPIGTSEILIVNELGAIIFKLNCEGETSKNINIQSYPIGIYLIKYNYRNTHFSKKILFTQ